MRAKWVPLAAAALLLTSLVPAAAPATAALPTEPTATVTVYPSDPPPVDASGVNPVDTSFLVNITGSNIRPQPHTMWVNVTFSTSTGWKVNPTKFNITWTLAANGGEMTTSVPVTVTVPPKVSANVVSVFAAGWTQENTIRFGQGQAGNATAQIHIRQLFSTSAEFSNGTSQVSVKQGQDVAVNMRVTNRGNGDAQYDTELKNAAELLPSDILLKSTSAATVIQNGTGNVTAIIHANPYAIAGTYTLQLRVLASGAGTPPPAGAFADLTAQLLVVTSTPPPSNNTTQPPPPPGNNTTNPPPPPPPPPDNIAALINFLKTPVGIFVDGLIVLGVVGLVMMRGRRKKAKKAREEQLQKARDARRPGGKPGAMIGPGGPPGPGGRPGGPGAPRPGGPQGAAPRPGAPPSGRPLPPRPQGRGPPGGPVQRPGAPPSK